MLFAWGPCGELFQNVSGHDHIPEGRFLDSVVVSGLTPINKSLINLYLWFGRLVGGVGGSEKGSVVLSFVKHEAMHITVKHCLRDGG